MRKMLLLFLLCFTLPLVLSAQEVVQSFDAELPEGYFGTESSANSDSTLSFTELSIVTDPVAMGEGALKVEYSVHNSESWGGYTKIEHVLPADGGVFNWSEFDSISFWYYNETPQSLPGRINLRFELYDVSNVPDTTTNAAEMEFYYSFHYVMDNAPGWNEIKMPLVDGRDDPDLDEWNGEAFNRTGWSGVEGNDKLDKDKIKGFAWEFSISGSGDGDASAGVIILDHLTLKGSKSVLTLNPGFEDGVLDPWQTYEGGGGTFEVKQGNAYDGDYYLEIGITDNMWAVALQSDFPAAPKEGWILSAWVRDFSEEDSLGDFAAMKIEPKDADGNLTGETPDVILPGVTSEWKKYVISRVLPENTVTVTATLVASKWSGDGKSVAYGFDNIALAKTGEIDDIPPEIPQNVAGNPAPGQGFNIVTWDDVPGEEGESYVVYASEEPFDDITAPGVEFVARVVEGADRPVHHLYYPLVEKDLTYYYAVVCVDASLNESEPGFSESVTNTAKAMATISLNPPTDFDADGDLSEWAATDIMPFRFNKTLGSNVGSGLFDDDADLDATAYLAVDDHYLYMAFDVIDNIFSFQDKGEFWLDDVVVVFIGLYNQTQKHTGFQRGAEPDYRFNLIRDRFNHDVASLDMYTNEDDNYEFTDFGASDYAVEVKIPLDSLLKGAAADDARFHPVRGMKIPLDIEFHDADTDGLREGIYVHSPFNNDNSWQGPQNWYHTWIGDTNKVATSIEKGDNVVTQFHLAQNYPNPFNPQTTIQYSVSHAAMVNISVYNTLGQKITTLVNARHTAGTHVVTFDGSGLPSGLYFYQIEAGDFVQTRKMLLVK